MTATFCSTCREPRVPLIRCATCDALSCDLCSFGDDLICLRCNQRCDNVTKEEPMTILDAITELRAIYPGVYVSVDLNTNWQGHSDTPNVDVHLYVENIGHVVWGARSIAGAMAELHAKRAGTDGSDVATSDADIAAVVAHVA